MAPHAMKGLTVATYLLIATKSLCQELSKPCPLQDAAWFAPLEPSKSEAVIKAKEAFEAELIRGFKSDEMSTYGDLGYSNSFAVEVYSINEPEALHSHLWTAPIPTESGQKTLEANSIFRIGSVSKLITTYIYLINTGFKGWNDPITDYLPQLKYFAAQSKTDPVNFVNWDQVTIGALASHLAGITTDGAPGPSSDAKFTALGLPEVPGADGQFCGNPSTQEFPCDDEEFIQNINIRHPIFHPFADAPSYSNVALMAMALALEKITKKPFTDLFDDFVQTLGLNGTSDHVPKIAKHSYIPINASTSWYDLDLRSHTPGGGYYSTVRDLRKVGTAILNSTLMPSSRTRQWMKPSSLTSNPNVTVGAPWEIYRAPIDRHSWMYTKSGDVGMYSTNMILLQEYDMGITVMAAGYNASKTVRVLSDMVASIFVPAIEQAAKDTTSAVFAGTYSDRKTNSSITLQVRADEPGLTVAEWSMGGLDVLSLMGLLYKASKVMAHLYPTGVKSLDGGQIAWNAIFEAPKLAVDSIFDSPCTSWFSADRVVYGGVGSGEFLFHMDEAGESAEALEFRMLHAIMPKVGGSTLVKIVGDGNTS